MNFEQVEAVVRAVEAVCPAQNIDTHTAGVWHYPLADLDARTALQAVGELSKTHKFIAPADIREWVDRQRKDRINHAVIPEPPVDPDDTQAYAEGVRKVTALIATGGHVNDVRALEAPNGVRPADAPQFEEMRQRHSGLDPEFLARRREAEKAECRSCGAPVGKTCTGEDGKPLRVQPACWVRLADRGLADPTPDRDPDQVRAEFAARIAAGDL